MSTLKVCLKDNREMQGFINTIADSLYTKGYMDTPEAADTAQYGFDNNRAFVIRCHCADKPVEIITPISNVGYLLFGTTRVVRVNKPELNLSDLLCNRNQTYDETLEYMKKNIRRFMAETIIATYPRS